MIDVEVIHCGMGPHTSCRVQYACIIDMGECVGLKPFLIGQCRNCTVRNAYNSSKGGSRR